MADQHYSAGCRFILKGTYDQMLAEIRNVNSFHIRHTPQLASGSRQDVDNGSTTCVVARGRLLRHEFGNECFYLRLSVGEVVM
jgi:hypothetical protein